ncbi:MAG: glycosyltransferase family A protein [Chloroflexi bacterium]|nr:glycosyltransferase family A protein [Chloroflexota bacterium]
MRVGHNPARFVENVAQPAEVTVVVVNCIPFLSGYYEQSLDVLKVVVESLHATREPTHPYDVMVFDNHSCAEVREYLKEASDQGKIQYLVLSDANIGKIGAWNYMFGAAAGKYIVFSDGDIGFRPGWFSASLDLFDTFPNVGMVTARPLYTKMEFSDATLNWARSASGVVLEEGLFISDEANWEHARSLGMSEEEYHQKYADERDYRVTYNGKTALVGAAHFQFMARREVLQKIIPLSSNQPMRGERALDIAINERGLLRLMPEQPWVWHMGNNMLSTDFVTAPIKRKKSLLKRFLHLSVIQRFLLWINNQIFRLYFFNVD